MMVFNNIKLAYKANQVLDSFNLKVGLGECTALIGKNGSGKTSFIKIVCDIINFTGNITIEKDLIKRKDYLYKKKIGISYIEQSFYSEDITLREHFNLLLSLYKHKKDIYRLSYYCDALDISLKSSTLIRDFSSGMKQKALFIGSIIHEPTYIFLDEPFSNMDDFSISACKNIILDLKKQQKGILLITHNSNIIKELCDRIVLLDKGKNALEMEKSKIDDRSLTVEYNGSYLEYMLKKSREGS